MKALITGGAGFIGSNLAMELQSRGYEVTILDNFSKQGSYNNLLEFQGDVIVADVTDPSWNLKVKDIDMIFHLASVTDTTITDDHEMLRQNIDGFRNVLEFALARRIKVVFSSSAGVYGNSKKIPYKETTLPMPLNVYAYSKQCMERIAATYVKKHSLPIVALRYFNVYGPKELFKGKSSSMIFQLYNQIKSGKRPHIFKFGEQERDQVYVEDVVAATILASQKDVGKFDVFNIGSGQSVSFNTIIEHIQKELGTDLKTEYLDNPYNFYQNHTLSDISKAKSILGYKPKYDAKSGIKKYIGILEGKA
jgi:ADP-L-glycero-D-manno-heptose 6-epimerase